jgi:hypothetical protein
MEAMVTIALDGLDPAMITDVRDGSELLHFAVPQPQGNEKCQKRRRERVN